MSEKTQLELNRIAIVNSTKRLSSVEHKIDQLHDAVAMLVAAKHPDTELRLKRLEEQVSALVDSVNGLTHP